FFRAEDGIRDFHVTGVQTCALPIYPVAPVGSALGMRGACAAAMGSVFYLNPKTREPQPSGASPPDPGAGERSLLRPGYNCFAVRSEERRVGREGRSGWWGGDSRAQR